jgi:hypothetical protein
MSDLDQRTNAHGGGQARVLITTGAPARKQVTP